MNSDQFDNLLFTVFTPTYNRKDLIHRVYNSLQKQVFTGFEWVIIDDGSIDNTKELIEQWQREATFKIIYHWQPNQGKHIALNAIGNIAKGELLLVIDSDDELVPQALERLKFYWDKITPGERESVAGISCLINDQHGALIGQAFPKDYQIADLIGMGLVNRITGDKGVLIQTKVFKQYKFPTHLNNMVVGEGALWFQMAKDWKMCFLNEVLVVAWIEHREDSLKLLSTSKENYPAAHYYHLCFLNYNMRFFIKRPKHFAGEATRYAQLSFYLKKSLTEQITQIKPFSAKLLWVLFMPLGFVFYLKDRIRR